MKRATSIMLLLLLLAGCMPWDAATPLPETPSSVAIAPTPLANPSAAPATATSAPEATALPAPEPPTPAPTLSADQRMELFNDVWQTVDEHYLYADFHGTDWQALRDEFAPQVSAAADDATFYGLLETMVLRLGDQHSRFARPVDARTEDALSSGTETYVGIGVLSNHEDHAAFVTLVFPDSPAEEAGIMRGDRITAVNGEPFTSTDSIRGPEGTEVTLTIETPFETPRELTVMRRAVIGKIVPSSRRLANAPEIGYMLIPSLWSDDMHTQVVTQLQQLAAEQPPLAGLIIDLRGNGGGWRSVLEGILSQFMSGKAGEFFSQSTDYALEIKPGSEFTTYHQLPLVVLVDKDSASYSEVLAGALQYQGATVIGTASQGNTETIFQYNFDDGSRLWVAQEGFKLPDGTNFEGTGVQPNYVINDDWTHYSLTTDPAILSAIAAIKEPRGR